MKRRDRVAVAALVLGGVAAAAGLVLLASQLCPGPTPTDPCPDADRNRLVVVSMAGLVVLLVMTPLAFIADYRIHRRIAYLGAWSRAVRRGALSALALASAAGLRLVDALNPFSAAVVVAVAVAAEWLAIRRIDADDA